MYELGDLRAAVVELRNSLEAAIAGGRGDLVSQIRASLAVALLEHGSTGEAIHELDLAEREAQHDTVGRIIAQRALLFHHLGRFDDAVAEGSRALPFLRGASDVLGECRSLVNRGISHLATGALNSARADLIDCLALAASIDQQFIVAGVAHALGAVALREGSIPAALAHYEDARRQYELLGNPARMMAILESDFSEAYSLCGLSSEALSAAKRALDLAGQSGNAVHESEALLRLAVASNQANRPEEAVRHATLAAVTFRESGRVAWAGLAELRAVQARLRHGTIAETVGVDLATVERLISVLEHDGWHDEAIESTLVAAELAAIAGQPDRAREYLGAVDWSRRVSSLTSATGYYVEAVLRREAGDLTGFTTALHNGIRHAATFQRLFGATELRVQASTVSDRLTSLGVLVALDQKDPEAALRWSEERRAASLRSKALDSPISAEIAAHLVELRSLSTQRRQLAGSDQQGAATAHAAIAAKEGEIVRLSRTAAGGKMLNDEPVNLGQLRKALGGRTLISFFESSDVIHACVVNGSSIRLAQIGNREEVNKEATYLRSGIHRLFGSEGDASAIESASAAIDLAAGQLDKVLFGALHPLGSASGEVIVVLSKTLQGVPLGLLPSFGRNDHVVAPSTTAWWAAHRASRSRRESEGVGVAVGPDMPFGKNDFAAVRLAFPIVSSSSASPCTSRQALELLASCDHVHIAAHGTFRRDNPLFSSLRFTDGPVSIFDLQQLPKVPRTLVLAACDAASVQATGIGEVVGTAMALLGQGVCSIVAPSAAVPDAAVATTMKFFYNSLAQGATTSAALKAVRVTLEEADPITRVTARLLAVHGASITVTRRRPPKS